MDKYCQLIFQKLVKKYISDYDPPKKDQELESEFENQKANMTKIAKELAFTSKTMKLTHSKGIEENRKNNSKLIGDIETLKTKIKEKNQQKSKEAADSKHLDSIAAIEAHKKMKYLEEVEYNSKEEKIEVVEKKIVERRGVLEKKKKELIDLEVELEELLKRQQGSEYDGDGDDD